MLRSKIHDFSSFLPNLFLPKLSLLLGISFSSLLLQYRRFLPLYQYELFRRKFNCTTVSTLGYHFSASMLAVGRKIPQPARAVVHNGKVDVIRGEKKVECKVCYYNSALLMLVSLTMSPLRLTSTERYYIPLLCQRWCFWPSRLTIPIYLTFYKWTLDTQYSLSTATCSV